VTADFSLGAEEPGLDQRASGRVRHPIQRDNRTLLVRWTEVRFNPFPSRRSARWFGRASLASSLASSGLITLTWPEKFLLAKTTKDRRGSLPRVLLTLRIGQSTLPSATSCFEVERVVAAPPPAGASCIRLLTFRRDGPLPRPLLLTTEVLRA